VSSDTLATPGRTSLKPADLERTIANMSGGKGKRDRELAVDTAIGVLGVAAGASGGLAALAVWATFAPSISLGVKEMWNRRVADLNDVLAEEGLSPEMVVKALRESDVLTDMFARTMRQVVATESREKRRVLARALARVLTEDAEVDVESRILTTLSVCDVPEIRVLAIAGRLQRQERDARSANQPKKMVCPGDILDEWHGVAAIYPAVEGTLISQGLIGKDSLGEDPDCFEVSLYGYKILKRLREERRRIENEGPSRERQADGPSRPPRGDER
jgi:hypothetical protein